MLIAVCQCSTYSLTHVDKQCQNIGRLFYIPLHSFTDHSHKNFKIGIAQFEGSRPAHVRLSHREPGLVSIRKNSKTTEGNVCSSCKLGIFRSGSRHLDRQFRQFKLLHPKFE